MSADFLRIGDRGKAIKALQAALLARGFNPGLVDGDFGADLQAARRLVNGGVNGLDRFQEAYHIGQDLLPA
jgi:peptidoglycan hydrolase-like protein with peptidoglycan-binding domain